VVDIYSGFPDAMALNPFVQLLTTSATLTDLVSFIAKPASLVPGARLPQDIMIEVQMMCKQPLQIITTEVAF
jgi:hypothetical protein